MVMTFPRLGVPDIDEQHQRLFNCIELLGHRVGTQLELPVVFTVLSQLLQYVDEHFRFEEDLLHTRRYEHVQDHIASHNRLRKDFEALFQRAMAEEDISSELVSLLEQWLVQHIDTEDRQYVDEIGLR